MQTIIIPADFSNSSHTAIAYGAALASNMNASLLLYHAFSQPLAVTQAPIHLPTTAMLTKTNTAILQNIGEQIQQEYSIHVEYFVSASPIIDELTKLVFQKQPALVVMGKHASHNWERTLFGGNSAAIIRKAAFPVLIIPDNISFHPPARLLFACDYKSLTPSTSLDWLQQIAGKYHADVEVLYVMKNEMENNHSFSWSGVNLDQILYGIQHHYLFMKAADVVVGIEKGLHRFDAELLVMAPHKYTFWDILLRKSITRRLAFRVNIPILLLPLE